MESKLDKARKSVFEPSGRSDRVEIQANVTDEASELDILREALESVPSDMDDDILRIKELVEQSAVVEAVTSNETRESILSSLFGQEN